MDGAGQQQRQQNGQNRDARRKTVAAVGAFYEPGPGLWRPGLEKCAVAADDDDYRWARLATTTPLERERGQVRVRERPQRGAPFHLENHF